MAIKILVDMNLSPAWISLLQEAGYSAIHWSSVGAASAADSVIMEWARAHEYVVFTHDLDFGTMLALSHNGSPSILQVRSQDILPESIGKLVLKVLMQHSEDLKTGALVVVEESKQQVRILPIR